MNIKEFKLRIRNFKPQFGNLNHQRAIDLIEKMNKRDKKAEHVDELISEIEDMDTEIDYESRQLLNLMESTV